MSACPHPTTPGAQLAAIGDDLDRLGAAWEAAGYPDEGPIVTEREAAFRRLRQWNAEHAGGAA